MISEGLEGEVPLAKVLAEGRRRELVNGWPDRPTVTGKTVRVEAKSRWGEVFNQIEDLNGWSYDSTSRRFLFRSATHPLDGPDDFGDSHSDNPVRLDPRLTYAVRVRFVSGGFSLGIQEIGSSIQWVEFAASVPAGVQSSWGSSAERSYTNGVQSAEGSGSTVATTRGTAGAGFSFMGMAGGLSAGFIRMTGQIEVSSFASSAGLDRSVVTLPVDADIPRYTWVCIMKLSTVDANVSASLGKLAGLGAGVNAVSVFVRVD